MSSSITLLPQQFDNVLSPVQYVGNANLTLTNAMSGSTFVINNGNSTGSVTLTLGAVASSVGWQGKILIQSLSKAFNVILSFPAGTLNGVLVEGTTMVLATNNGSLTFVQGTCVQSDYVDIFSDGSFWYCKGVTQVNAACTVA